MRLLYLAPDLLGPPGGIARYCRLVCQALLASGFELQVSVLADQFKQAEEAKVLFPGMRYETANGSRAAFVRQAVAASLRERPDILLVGHPNFASLGRMVAGLRGVKPVVFMYGIDVWERLSWMRLWGLRSAAQVIAISQFTLDKARQVNGVPPDKGRVLYNCLDPEFESASPARPTAPRLLTVARMSLAEQYKGHDYVIRALPALLTRFPGLTYHVVGDGDGRPLLEQLAEQLGVAASVHFHGFVSEAELHHQYQVASIFIMPSQAEGFGFVFAEAMAYGLPVIGGNCDATPEVVADGVTGLLVDPTSTAAIEAAADRLLGDDDLRRRMGQAGRARVDQLFSFEAFTRTLQAYLAELDTTSMDTGAN